MKYLREVSDQNGAKKNFTHSFTAIAFLRRWVRLKFVVTRFLSNWRWINSRWTPSALFLLKKLNETRKRGHFRTLAVFSMKNFPFAEATLRNKRLKDRERGESFKIARQASYTLNRIQEISPYNRN